jgi:squalene-associated FAD-dependent desaturase
VISRTVHVVGAGIAGLATCVRLAQRGASIFLHEAAPHAGGRCRSYHDPVLDMVIDNGNHLLLSGNHAALEYLTAVGAKAELTGPAHADFAFVDLAAGQRWTLRINDGGLPWWVLRNNRRVPGTRASDYFSFARLLWSGGEQTVCAAVKCAGPLYERLARPLWLAALNTDPKEASAKLARAVTRETLARGGRACRPLIAANGLTAVFIEPALNFLSARNVKIELGHRLRALAFDWDKVAALDFGDNQIKLGAQDCVVLAVPPIVAGELIAGLTVPREFRAIVNAHFHFVPPPALPLITGVINGTIEWLFVFRDRLSVTISCADRFLEERREVLAAKIWNEVAVVAELPKPMPPWQIVRERRATFAATPAENARRPEPITAWSNLFLAGDWINTGLPATIEGAVRSGNRAAELVLNS